jgi:hypothetical protein
VTPSRPGPAGQADGRGGPLAPGSHTPPLPALCPVPRGAGSLSGYPTPAAGTLSCPAWTAGPLQRLPSGRNRTPIRQPPAKNGPYPGQDPLTGLSRDRWPRVRYAHLSPSSRPVARGRRQVLPPIVEQDDPAVTCRDISVAIVPRVPIEPSGGAGALTGGQPGVTNPILARLARESLRLSRRPTKNSQPFSGIGFDSPTFRQLQSPAADVTALRDVLEDPAIGGYAVDLLKDEASYAVNQAIDKFFASRAGAVG